MVHRWFQQHPRLKPVNVRDRPTEQSHMAVILRIEGAFANHVTLINGCSLLFRKISRPIHPKAVLRDEMIEVITM